MSRGCQHCRWDALLECPSFHRSNPWSCRKASKDSSTVGLTCAMARCTLQEHAAALMHPSASKKPAKYRQVTARLVGNIAFLFHSLQICLNFGEVHSFHIAWSHNFKLVLFHWRHRCHQARNKNCRFASHLPPQSSLGKPSALVTYINTTTECMAKP